MLTKIKTLTLTLAMTFMALLPIAVPVTTYAACNSIQDSISQGINAATKSSQGCGQAQDSNLSSVAANVVNIFSIIVGVVAVIMIIYGGFRYITSGGDSGNVSSAKNTLIYAIVGLIIVALAQFIVHFVLTGASNAVTTQ